MTPIIEVFNSIQGEGIYAGTPSLFIRVSGCNLRCMFGKSKCDTPYASFNPEKSIYGIEQIKKIWEEDPFIEHVVITGGEPLLYQENEDFQEIVDFFAKEIRCSIITVETNGTIVPNRFMLNRVRLWSVSPKLKSSTPHDINPVLIKQHEKLRINIPALKIFADQLAQFKFVLSSESDEAEIKRLIGEAMLPFDSIMLMPEGNTEEILQYNRQYTAQICIKNGWRYSERLHIIIWGDKRGY